MWIQELLQVCVSMNKQSKKGQFYKLQSFDASPQTIQGEICDLRIYLKVFSW